MFGTRSETLTSKAREVDDTSNPVKSGQTVLGLKIHGFEMCDFSLRVVTPTSKDIAVKYIIFLIACMCTNTERKQKEQTITNVSFSPKLTKKALLFRRVMEAFRAGWVG